MNDRLEIPGVIFVTTLVLTIGFLTGHGCAKSIRKPAIPNESLRTEFERGRLQGMQETCKLLGDLGMEGKVIHMGLPIGHGRWMNMKYEVIHSGLTVEQASNLWFAAMFSKTNSTSITISNASEKTITVTFPKPYEAKEAKLNRKIEDIHWAHVQRIQSARNNIALGYSACRLGMPLSNFLADLEVAWSNQLHKQISEVKEDKP